MRKVTKLSFHAPYVLSCVFDNGEERYLNLENALDKNQKYASKVFEGDTYKTAKIGIFGEIYWDNIAEITALDGKSEPCNYDISPEYAYLMSEPKNTANQHKAPSM